MKFTLRDIEVFPKGSLSKEHSVMILATEDGTKHQFHIVNDIVLAKILTEAAMAVLDGTILKSFSDVNVRVHEPDGDAHQHT